MNEVHICRPSRGRYGPPIRIPEAKIRWVDDDGHRIRAPNKVPCDSTWHIGRKVWFPRRQCYVRVWTLTQEEKDMVIEEYDMMSIGVPPQFLCPECAKRHSEKADDE